MFQGNWVSRSSFGLRRFGIDLDIVALTLKSGIHDLRHSAGPRLCDDDPDGDTDTTHEAEDGEIGEEDELSGVGLDELQTDTEWDDELVAGDGWNKQWTKLGGEVT